MFDLEFLGLLLALVAIATPIFAIVAFVQVGTARKELAALRDELRAMKQAAPPRAPAAPAAAKPPEPQTMPAAAPAPPRPVSPQPVSMLPPKPTAPLPPPPNPSPTTDWARTSANIERMVAANWLIWIGAAALALGGIFLVRFAWEQGYFGPAQRTAAALLAGIAMIGWSEWLRRRARPDAPGQMRFAPLAVATAGVITLYATAYAAGPLYGFIPAIAAFAGFFAASAVAVALAVVHGSFLAALGIAGAYVAPLLVGGGEPEPLLVLGYSLAVTLAALVLIRAFAWRRIVWIALAGVALWTLIGVSWMQLATGPLALAIFLVVIVAASTWLAWDDAEETPPLNQTVIASNAFWVVASVGLIFPLLAAGLGSRLDPVLAGAAIYAAGAIFAGWRRTGFAMLPLAGAVVAIVAASLIPLSTDHYILAGTSAYEGSFERFLAFVFGGSAVMGVGGWLAMRTMHGKAVMATVSAFTPVILLALAFVRIAGFTQGFQWGVGGIVLALLNLLALDSLSRAPGGLDAQRGASSAYALGGFAASMFAVASSLQPIWMTALFALHLPAIALVDKRFNLSALRLAGAIASFVVLMRLTVPQQLLSHGISPAPLWNELLPLYGVPILSFWGAARIRQSAAADKTDTVAQAYDVGAIVLGAIFLSIEVRHIATAGQLDAPLTGVAEIGAYCASLAAMSLGLAARLGRKTEARPRLWVDNAVQLVSALAVLIAIAGLGIAMNPLFRSDFGPASAFSGPIILDLLTPAYLTPAALLGVQAWLRRRQGRVVSGHILGFTALTLVFLYATLEVRNWFHDDLALSAEPVGQAESYAYSVVWILFAIATLMLGVARRRVSIRHAAMAVLALSVVKVFVFDMASLDGVLRAASFFGLGIALIGIALLYQRLIFRRDASAAATGPG